QVLERDYAAANPKDRLLFDQDTWTITLDGKEYSIKDPKAFQVYRVIYEAGPTTKSKIQSQVPGTKGDKTIPNLLGNLPAALKNTIENGTWGYRVRLAKKKVLA